MTELFLVGIGTGNPDHLTLQAIKALNAVDLILIPRKGDSKADLADLRRAICADVLTNSTTHIAEFDLPTRDETIPSYLDRAEAWHDAIAAIWARTIAQAAPENQKVALLVWGDPSLYDSTLRIAARLSPAPSVTVIPGITSLQALTAAHAIPLNALAGPVTITTGRRLRDFGWPEGASRIAVMLDGDCAFQTLPPEGMTIWWGAYVGMAEQVILSGDLASMTPQILETRAALRADHGWLMDIYLLDRSKSPAPSKIE